MRIILTTFVLTALASVSVAGQRTGGISVGYVSPPTTDTGAAVTGWYGVQSSRFRLQLLGDMIFSPDEDYYRDSFDGGGSACRNANTGQFVDDAQCAPEIDPAVRSELLVRLGSNLLVGPGYRLGEDSSIPYGAIGYETPIGLGKLLVRGGFGEKYAQLDVGLSF
jgi:hypothetical protein